MPTTGISPACHPQRSQYIKVSLNELGSLTRRALEGCQYVLADCDDAASAVVWLESSGIAVLDEFVNGLHDTTRPASPKFAKQAEQSNLLTGHGESLLLFATLIAECAMGATQRQSVVSYRLQEFRDTDAAIFLVRECARLGLHALAHWSVDAAFVATSDPTQVRPCVSYHEKPENRGDVYLFASREAHDLQRAISTQKVLNHQTTKTRHSPEQLASNEEEAIQQGISIASATYRKMTAFAENVLVESSERSRSGAGE